MNYLILAAGSGIDSIESNNNIPKCLLDINGKSVIDNIEIICSDNNIENISIVGGFEILKIMEKYPKHKLFYNEKWKDTNSLYSLQKAIDILDDDMIVSYSDIIHKSDTVKKLIKNKKNINVVYDSLWETRYKNRDVTKFEKIYDINNNLVGEFTGLFFIPKEKIPQLRKKLSKLLNQKINATVLDLINLISNDKDIELIDIRGNWTELDSIQDIEHFEFGTKSETLKSLQNKLKKSLVLEQITFNVGDFEKNKNNIITNIQSKLNSKLLVVRSSALNEDTHNSSMAGSYESILKVIKDDDINLKNSIEIVINSYTKNNQDQDTNNQILVQPYLENVTMSGVVFTKNLQTSSPYYTINYDESDDTESVTSGSGDNLNTFICYRDFKEKINNKYLDILIKAIKEIESIAKFDAIDVEFAFVNEKLYILQVRPIAAHKDTLKVLDSDIDNEINNLRDFLLFDSNPNLLGNKKAFGVMPDWNPAEIIGINPKPLAFDLYKYIITDNVWAKSRNKLGYRDVSNSAGLISFAQKPYVDIKMSFNSFIPNTLDSTISEKLVDYFINKLEKYPENHDKVEFNIAITAFDFEFNEKKKELIDYGFASYEVKEIFSSYKKLTNDIVTENIMSIEDELNKSIILKEKREKIIKSNMSVFDKIYNLLEDCKEYGTLPFSNLARYGFVGSILLKSLLSKNIITNDEYAKFLKSIHTVAKDFMDDFNLLVTKKLTKNEFISRYGHLRPGTYDINSLTYQNNFDGYIDSNSQVVETENIDNFKFPLNTIDKIELEIKKHKLDFDVHTLISFIRRSTEAREKAKFEFTKNLSLILNLIESIIPKYDILVEDLAYLNLDYILKYKNNSSRINITDDLKKNITINKKKYLLTIAIQLPELIFCANDIDMFFYSSLKPNFITHLHVENEIIILDNNSKIDIDNKIVVIENADPGFDWIFSHNIKGLVTKYGGAASHMAIRCAEFDLPAAIGCGDKIYKELLKYNKISLDCINQKIRGVH